MRNIHCTAIIYVCGPRNKPGRHECREKFSVCLGYDESKGILESHSITLTHLGDAKSTPDKRCRRNPNAVYSWKTVEGEDRIPM